MKRFLVNLPNTVNYSTFRWHFQVISSSVAESNVAESTGLNLKSSVICEIAKC